ncbi:MAG: tetratricopeptide repeat protein [Gemmatimonadota bacterium]|nr:tetratricopeptide repeat protein [Gemmatimonadota bacterium]
MTLTLARPPAPSGVLSALMTAAILLAGCTGEGVPPPLRVPLGDHADERVAAMVDSLAADAEASRNSADARGRLGLAYEACGLHEAAARSFRHAIALAPDAARWHFHEAMSLSHQGETRAATLAMRRSVDLDEDYAPARWRLAQWLLDLGQPQEAAAEFERAINRKPNHPAGWLGLARTQLQLEDYAGAVESVEAFLSRRPESPYVPYARYLRGTANRADGNMEDALRDLGYGGSRPRWADPREEEVEEYRIGFVSLLQKAFVLLHSGNPREALSILRELRPDHPEDPTLLNYLSYALLESGFLDRAQKLLTKMLEESPNVASTHINFSVVFSRRGMPDRALHHADRAIELNPVSVDAHRRRGEVCTDLERHGNARDSFEFAARLDPADAELVANTGWAEIRLGQPENAAVRFDRALLLEPGNPHALAGRAVVLAETGDIPAGRRLINGVLDSVAHDWITLNANERIKTAAGKK